MKRFTAAKKLDALDTRLDSLESERRALEIEALGAEVAEAERAQRYAAIADERLRTRLIDLDRSVWEVREKERAAAIDYWSTMVGETRGKLDDLRSDSPTSAWRRRIWWDVATVLWILGGAGWLAYGIAGAAAGVALTAIAGWYIARNRERARLEAIRAGEDLLRANERELAQARRDADAPARGGALPGALQGAPAAPLDRTT